jgi:hypothetical protein
MTRGRYDELFSSWVWCETNMAQGRQTRALAHAAPRPGAIATYNLTAARSTNALCDRLPAGRDDPRCPLARARSTLYQLAVVGLNEHRCATET